MDSKQIITKIITLIKKNGIPKHIKKFKLPKKIPSTFKNENEMVRWITDNITRKYHKHTTLINNEWSKTNTKDKTMKNIYEKYGNPRKLPDIFWDNKNKIGRIKYYHFWGAYTKTETMKDTNKLVTFVRKTIQKWLKKDIKGIIIDVREHTGGDMWPFTHSLYDILGNSTLFAFTNKKITKKQKGWINNYQNINTYKKKELKIKIPIAVIYGKKTMSSGEFGAAIFKGRKNAKSFGKKSGGYLSANQEYNINDKYTLLLTCTYIQTVDMEFNDSGYLMPDVITDKPITKAKQWIKQYNIKN